MPIDKRQLRKIIDEHFNESELKDLAFELGIEYDNLEGRTKSNRVISLVEYARRHGLTDKLIGLVEEEREGVLPDGVAGGSAASGGSDTPSSQAPAQPTQQFNFHGPVTGATFGQNSPVNAQNIAGGDISIGGETPKNLEEFRAHLDVLKQVIDEAVEQGAFVSKDDEITAVADLNTLTQEAKKERPRPNVIKMYLDGLHQIVTKATETGSALLKAAPIVAGLKKAAELIFGG